MSDAGQIARIENLEIRIAYQDQVIDDLNKTIAAQWSEIDALKRRMAQLLDRVQDVESMRGGPNQPEPPPPHY